MISELKTFDKKIFNEINKLVNFETNDPSLLHYQITVSNFYTIDESVALKIFIILKNNKFILPKKDQKTLKNLAEKFEFLVIRNHNFEFIKNNEDYVFAMISIFVLKAFLQKTYKFSESNDFLFNHTQIFKKIKKYDSYSILNHVTTSFTLFTKWVDLTSKSTQSAEEYRDFLFSIFMVLENKGIIKKTNIKIKAKETNSFWILNEIIRFDYKLLNLPFSEYKILELNNIKYLCNGHFSSLTKIFTKNKKSGAVFKLNDGEFLQQIAKKTTCYLSRNSLESIFNKKMEHCDMSVDELKKYYDAISKEITRAIDLKDKNLLKELSQKLSLYENLLRLYRLLELIKEDVQIYLPFIFDFRGRLYYVSDISPTFYPEIRYCLYSKNIITFSYINEFTPRIKQKLKEHFYLINDLKKFNFKTLPDEKKEYILWILIFIAECQKTKLGKTVHFITFIQHGISLIDSFENFKNDFSLEDFFHISYAVKVLQDIERGDEKKWLFQKDSTASVYQILGKSLGYKSKEFLKYCNLRSEDTWYDTYEYILETFRSKIKIKHLTINELYDVFSRKRLKKSIMTENYLATYPTFKKYFLDEVELEKYEIEKQEEILDLLIDFFNFLKRNEELFENNPDIILIKIKEEDRVLEFVDKSNVDYTYNKLKTKQKEITIENKRYTKKFKEITNQFDTKKFKTSTRANYVHSLDAALMRGVLRWGFKHDLTVLGLHDCWMVDYTNMTNLVAALNEQANIAFHTLRLYKTEEKFYSIFIII